MCSLMNMCLIVNRPIQKLTYVLCTCCSLISFRSSPIYHNPQQGHLRKLINFLISQQSELGIIEWGESVPVVVFYHRLSSAIRYSRRSLKVAWPHKKAPNNKTYLNLPDRNLEPLLILFAKHCLECWSKK